MSTIDIARASTRQRSIAPYLDHLRLARLDTDQRQMKGSDEWIDNVRTWVDVISYLAGQSTQHKAIRLSESESSFSDLLLVETAAALATGAHFQQLRNKILDHATEWQDFVTYVNTDMEGDVQKYSKAK